MNSRKNNLAEGNRGEPELGFQTPTADHDHASEA